MPWRSAALCPPWGAVFCHESAHVMADECGAPEMFTGGAKLIGVEGRGGKIGADGARRHDRRLSARPRQAFAAGRALAVAGDRMRHDL